MPDNLTPLAPTVKKLSEVDESDKQYLKDNHVYDSKRKNIRSVTLPLLVPIHHGLQPNVSAPYTYSRITVPETEVPYGTDFALQMQDSSMDPAIPRHGLAFCSYASSLIPADVGVFVYQNEILVRSYYTYEGNDILRRKQIDREKTEDYNDADYYVTNESTLPKLYGGFGTTIKAYGVDFSINCSFSLGGKQYDGTYANFMANPEANNTGTNIHRDVLNAWSPENTTSDIPRWQYQDLYVSSQSTRFLTSSDYLNIENINLGYTLPKSFTRKFQVEGLRIYLAAENVCYISKRKGFDPRQSYSSTTNATNYSPMRTISGGLTVTF